MASRTNLGPLTTLFVYPDHCTHPVIQCSSCNISWQAQTCGANPSGLQNIQDDPECWPAPKTPVAVGDTLDGWGFYSHGLECPLDWHTACTATGGGDSDFKFQFSLLDGETAIGCCPLGYSCALAYGPQTCRSEVTAGIVEVFSCSSTKETVGESLTLPATFATLDEALDAVTAATVDTLTIYAPLIQLNSFPTDLPGNTDGGLSTGAKAGIGVGAGVAGLAVIGAAVYFWRRREKKRRPLLASEDPPSEEPKPAEPPEGNQKAEELPPGQTPLELPPGWMPMELAQPGRAPVELE